MADAPLSDDDAAALAAALGGLADPGADPFDHLPPRRPTLSRLWSTDATVPTGPARPAMPVVPPMPAGPAMHAAPTMPTVHGQPVAPTVPTMGHGPGRPPAAAGASHQPGTPTLGPGQWAPPPAAMRPDPISPTTADAARRPDLPPPPTRYAPPAPRPGPARGTTPPPPPPVRNGPAAPPPPFRNGPAAPPPPFRPGATPAPNPAPVAGPGMPAGPAPMAVAGLRAPGELLGPDGPPMGAYPIHKIEDVEAVKDRARTSLIDGLGARLYDPSLTEEAMTELVAAHLATFFSMETNILVPEEQVRITQEITDDLLRHGPIEPFLADPSIGEIMVNGAKHIYVERHGKLVLTRAQFRDDAQLRRVIERIVGRVGRRIDESSPMVDARLPDGSRVNAVIPPLAVDGPTLTIRKFTADGFTIEDLIRTRSVTPEVAVLLEICVRGRLNILVSGGTGSGKTTLLNILSSFIPSDERIVTIEDAVELRLRQPHVIRLESRPANIEGKGAVHIRDLVRNSLRMRPDRVVVGECRGGETLDMLQAMNTGHDGSLSTLHANSPRDTLSRIETMVLMSGMELPIRAIREQVASAVDLIVHTSRLRDGSRRVTHVSEVVGMEGDTITMNDVFLMQEYGEVDQYGLFTGTLKPTGIRPVFTERLAEHGIHVPTEVFGDIYGAPQRGTPQRGTPQAGGRS